MNTMNHSSGDIVKIPQNVIMQYKDMFAAIVTEKPMYGVYIQDIPYDNYNAEVFVENEIYLVPKRDIYPGEKHG